MKATAKENPPPGPIASITGRLKLGPQCGHCSAPIMLRDGFPVGIYVDDTTPSRRHWIEIGLAHHPSPQSVFVGIGPDEQRDTLEHPDIGVPHIPAPRLIRLKEWLPWGNAYGPGQQCIPWRDFGRVPRCQQGGGYILQLAWHGYYGPRGPNALCRQTITRQAKKHKPRFIFKV